MIKSWKHKGLKRFYEIGSKSGIQGKHAKILRMLLFQLTNSVKPEDMNTPGNGFHGLKGKLQGYHAVKVSGNWRLIFRFKDESATNVDLIDYH